MISQIPNGTESLEQLICEGKTLRGSAVETEDGAHRYGLRPTESMSPMSRSMHSLWVSPSSRRLLCSSRSC